MTTHTPAPWGQFWRMNADCLPELVITAENGCPIATVGNHAEYKQNAQLIMTAPDLLAAARRIAAWIEREGVPYLIDSDDNPGEALRSAIARAEGRS